MSDQTIAPRRIDSARWTPAERAIYAAALEVEQMPPDERLTEAVVLLGRARDLVADYVDARWDATVQRLNALATK